jgi:hypothetical protein
MGFLSGLFGREEEPEFFTKAEVMELLAQQKSEIMNAVPYVEDFVTREDVKDMIDTRNAIVDPPFMSRQEVVEIAVNIVRTESVSKLEVHELIQDALKTYDVEEDAEIAKMIEDKLSQKTDSEGSEVTLGLAEFKSNLYFGALTELKGLSSKPNLLSMRAFLVRFVDLFKP